MTDRGAWCRWIRRLALAQLVLMAAIFHTVRLLGQSQETINERVRILTENLQQRVASIEMADAAGRLRVLESDMAEVKWLGRSVALAVAGQLVIAGLGTREKRRT